MHGNQFVIHLDFLKNHITHTEEIINLTYDRSLVCFFFSEANTIPEIRIHCGLEQIVLFRILKGQVNHYSAQILIMV